ncbi:histone-lysine N-methyltransferase SETMAR [Plakobranchus ocellatus]|uniref:Histone-lysine N-methyltransferase SETMAR n=1 Tax=Plakobranchus ocellatus TaxID=259542 RepID=A0AAV4ADF7_9GAST|nr:histone-lysine N-methyltransferase SETMAR [Plakobranchus ocellatus]
MSNTNSTEDLFRVLKRELCHSFSSGSSTFIFTPEMPVARDILPQGQCINAARYCSTLDRLKEAIRRKRPGLLRRGAVLQHDNATPHSANLTQQWLQRYSWEILPHPAHSPDLAPSDFHLFGPLKRHLGGMAFETEDDLISELRNWFNNLDVDFFRVGINSLLSRWQKCIDLHGDYIEK